MEKDYGQFVSELSVAELKKDFKLGGDLVALIFKYYIKLFGYPDIGGAMRFPKVIKRLAPQADEKILDIGCGRGFYSHFIARSGAVITGIDDGPFVEIAQSMGRELKSEAKIYRANITKTKDFFNSGEQLFDKLLAVEVLEHLVEDQQSFADWCLLLKSGGKMIFSVPFATVEEQEKFKPDLVNDPYGHKRAGYTMEQIQQLCAANGMKIVEQEIYCTDQSSAITTKNGILYTNNNFIAILLQYPWWKWKCSQDKSATSTTSGFHAIILTLEKN